VGAFANAIAGAFVTLQSAAGTAVTFHRGNASVSVTAVPGQSALESRSERGAGVTTETRDFLVKASDLVINSAVVVPTSGDSITETVGVQVFTYLLVPPFFARHSLDGRYLRLHTTLSGTATA
jgi:hypothetical protein